MSQAHHSLDRNSSPRLNISAFKRLSGVSRSKDRATDGSSSHRGTLPVANKAPSEPTRAFALPPSPHPGQPRASGLIVQMGSGVAHQIRSAQVVLDPASIIKELLENSLDAGATRIDIRVRGKAALDSIAVSDNGKGVAKEDYSSLCLSASTSKISDFADLDSVATFGFRGEALSAICAISKSVSFVTRTTDDSVATSLQYGPDGSLQEQRPVARPKGATVLVDSLFHKLPVRRKDALKNSSREIARCVAVVQALALISVGTRIELKVCQDLKVLSQPSPPDGLMASPQSFHVTPLNLRGLRHTASCVLGNKTASALVEIPLSQVASVSLPPVERQRDHQSPEAEIIPSRQHYCCSGLVSKASLGANGSGGRARSSHQYIFANRRPVDFPRLTRAVNELYRRATGMNGASPVLVLNLDLPAGSHDVNLSPDKRDLLIRDESELISGLLKHLETVWAPKKAAEIPLQTLDFSKALQRTSGSSDKGMANNSSIRMGPISLTAAGGVTDDGSSETSAGQVKHTRSSGIPVDGVVLESSHPEDTSSSPAAIRPLGDWTGKTSTDSREIMGANLLPVSDRDIVMEVSPRSRGGMVNPKNPEPHGELLNSKSAVDRKRLLAALCPSKRNVAAFVARHAGSFSMPAKRRKVVSKFSSSSPAARSIPSSCMTELKDQCRPSPETCKPLDSVVTHIDGPSGRERGRKEQGRSVMKVNWSLVCKGQLPIGKRELLQGFDDRDRACLHGTTEHAFRKSSMSGESTLQDPVSKAAELEMSRLFRQEWFGELHILGQFNRGFIVCQLGQDLFIIDQHASDEKYNFEHLQRTTTISKQQLVRPLALEFSAQDELIVLQHIDGFRAGGFGIEYRPSKMPTQRLYLRSQPVSKHTMFVQDDLKDIVAMLKTTVLQSSSLSVGVLRPPRIRAMFASRACRKSVMIGNALQKPQMKRIVRNLTTIEHPWTCPHGRPTMRHLCTLPKT